MTLDEIEDLTEAEWKALPRERQAELMGIILESLTEDGVAYKAEDGRYRIREDVMHLGGDQWARVKPN
tara:strand:+ start:1759 stop:1962 length:204 start_codon:yes stop_codon:yes gene_type:complete